MNKVIFGPHLAKCLARSGELYIATYILLLLIVDSKLHLWALPAGAGHSLCGPRAQVGGQKRLRTETRTDGADAGSCRHASGLICGAEGRSFAFMRSF